MGSDFPGDSHDGGLLLMLKKSLLSVLLLGAGIAGASSKVSDETLLRCGPMTATPVIDGTISLQEADQSSQNYGFMASGTKLLTLRYGKFYFGYTDQGIYFAARCSIPPKPQKLKLAAELNRGLAII